MVSIFILLECICFTEFWRTFKLLSLTGACFNYFFRYLTTCSGSIWCCVACASYHFICNFSWVLCSTVFGNRISCLWQKCVRIFLPVFSCVRLLTFGVHLCVCGFRVPITDNISLINDSFDHMLTWISLTYLSFYVWKWIRYNATLRDSESFIVGLRCNCVIFVLVCCYICICNALI